MYVRFHAAAATPSGRRHPGIFALANSLAHEGRLSVEEYEWWQANNEWFENAYADPCKLDPTLFGRTVHPMTTCWFKVSAHHLLDRIPGYLRLLDDHGVPWIEVRRDSPGTILYEDAVQVVVT